MLYRCSRKFGCCWPVLRRPALAGFQAPRDTPNRLCPNPNNSRHFLLDIATLLWYNTPLAGRTRSPCRVGGQIPSSRLFDNFIPHRLSPNRPLICTAVAMCRVRSLYGRFRSFSVGLGSLWGRFGGALGSLWGHFSHRLLLQKPQNPPFPLILRSYPPPPNFFPRAAPPTPFPRNTPLEPLNP